MVTDQEHLACFLKSRDEQAFKALVERHAPMVYATCLRVLDHADDAEDASQATFLILSRKASTVKRKQNIGPWLHQVATRVALAQREKRQKIKTHESAMIQTPVDDRTVNEFWDKVQPHLDQEMAQLPSKYQEPLMLFYIEGRSREEVADALGWSMGKLHGCLERGRKLLRKKLLKRGVVIPLITLGILLEQKLVHAQSSQTIPDLTRTSEIAMVGLGGASALLSAGLVTQSTLSLAQGVLHAMLIQKIKYATVVVFAIMTLFGGAGIAYSAGFEEKAPPLTRDGTEPKGQHAVIFSLDVVHHERFRLHANGQWSLRGMDYPGYTLKGNLTPEQLKAFKKQVQETNVHNTPSDHSLSGPKAARNRVPRLSIGGDFPKQYNLKLKPTDPIGAKLLSYIDELRADANRTTYVLPVESTRYGQAIANTEKMTEGIWFSDKASTDIVGVVDEVLRAEKAKRSSISTEAGSVFIVSPRWNNFAQLEVKKMEVKGKVVTFTIHYHAPKAPKGHFEIKQHTVIHAPLVLPEADYTLKVIWQEVTPRRDGNLIAGKRAGRPKTESRKFTVRPVEE